MVNKKIICFDLDGTIINSIEAQVLSYKLVFEKYKLAKKTRKKIISLFGKTADEVVKGCFPELSDKKVKKIVKDFYKILSTKTPIMTKKIKNVVPALRKLKKDYNLALISNNPTTKIKTMLTQTKVPAELFDIILGDDEIKNPKPAPDAILRIEELAKGKVEFMVGDTIFDVKAGNAAKVKTIAVLSGVDKFDELYKEHPTVILSSVALIPEYLALT